MDIDTLHSQLCQRKVASFRKYLLGLKGGLEAGCLEEAGIISVDIRYHVIKKGTMVFGKRSRKGPQHVFTLSLDTLLDIVRRNGSKEDDGSDEELESVVCINVFEVSHDIRIMRIPEETASRVCQLWFTSQEKEDVQKENGVNDEINYPQLCERTDPSVKNLVDICFTRDRIPEDISGLVYTRPDKSYQVLVAKTVNDNVDFLMVSQDFVVPWRSLERLAVDDEGYLMLRDSPLQQADLGQEVDDVDGAAETQEESTGLQLEEQTKGPPVLPYADNHFPTAEEYNDYQDGGDASNYESIAIRPMPQDAAKPLSPRPEQPPPPPPEAEAEPVYGQVDRSAKKRQGRINSVDQADTPSSPGLRPPRPPPLETIPTADLGDSPAQISVHQKPSRPAAPPKIQRKTQSMDVGMGSPGGVPQDAKDDALVPPPRTSLKGKGRHKMEGTNL